MKKYFIAFLLWMMVCAAIGIGAEHALGYTFESDFDPAILNGWSEVPRYCNEMGRALKNPDPTAEIKAALIILEPRLVITASGPVISYYIKKYCYLKGDSFHSFELTVSETGEGHYAAEELDDETKLRLIEVLHICAGLTGA